MKTAFLLSLILASSALLAKPGQGGGKKHFKARKKMQRARVKHGMNNGSISKRERVGLTASRKHIQNYKKRASEDGWTKQEKKKLKRKMDKRSKQIYRYKHNDNGGNE